MLCRFWGSVLISETPYSVLAPVDTVNFLGISIVGQTNEDGNGGGIFVGSVMKG